MIEVSPARIVALVASTAAFAWAVPSIAADTTRWAALDGVATIALPAPSQATGLVGATLACAEQEWALDLQLSPEAIVLAGPMPATLSIGEQVFTVDASAAPGKVTLPVPGLAIGPLKTGTSATVAAGDGSAGITGRFSLRGSRVAIEAAAPLCSKRDMSGYERIALTPYSSYVLEAKELRKDEIEVFRQATTATPVVSAAKSVQPDGRSLLFVELCGSTWYYGASGCNIAVYGRRNDAAAWTQVYDAEGADLYLDNTAHVDGWPNIVALPKTGGGDDVRWAWNGDAYAVSDDSELASGPDAAPTQGEQ